MRYTVRGPSCDYFRSGGLGQVAHDPGGQGAGQQFMAHGMGQQSMVEGVWP